MLDDIPVRTFALDEDYEVITEHKTELSYRTIYALKEVVGQG